MKKFAILFIGALFMFTSCEETEAPIYDGSQTLAYFNGTTSDLPVEINGSATVNIEVGASTISTSDRTVTVSIDTDNSTADAAIYSVPTSVVIPANEYFGTLTVTGTDNGLTTDAQTLTLQIDGIDGGVASPLTHTVTIVEVCPIPADYLVGDYQIADVSAAIGPANGTENFAAGTVNITAATETSRTFNNGVLPAFAGTSDVTINLICNTLVLAELSPGLTCNGTDSYIFIDAGANNSSYDLSSDLNFTIFYTEDPLGSCGGPFLSSFSLTKL